MSNQTARFSAPPGPSSNYGGPELVLADDRGRQWGQLRADHDQVIIETRNGYETTKTVSGILTALSEVPSSDSTQVILHQRPWATRRTHGLLLLAAASRWPEFAHVDGDRYHLTLAYALPLALDANWLDWCEHNLDELVATTQLVAVPAANLVAVQPNSESARGHRRLLRRHAETTVIEHGDIDSYLNDWSHFSTGRYGRTVPDSERHALQRVLEMSGCQVRDLIHGGQIIGRSVVCHHRPSRTLFDLMATWDAGAARLRPGIFSGVHNVLDALSSGLRYSLCYGQFRYKDEIVGASPRLTLQDLLGA